MDDDGTDDDEVAPVVEEAEEEETKVGVVGVDLAEGFPGDARWAAEAVVVTCSCFFVLEVLFEFVDPCAKSSLGLSLEDVKASKMADAQKASHIGRKYCPAILKKSFRKTRPASLVGASSPFLLVIR